MDQDQTVIPTAMTRAERYFWRTTTLIILGDFLIGLGFFLDAPSKSSTFDIARELLPLSTWGVIAILSAAIYLFGLFRYQRTLMLVGLTGGAFFTVVFTLTFAMSLITGTLAGFTAIVWWGIIAIAHILSAIALPSSLQIERLKNDKRGL